MLNVPAQDPETGQTVMQNDVAKVRAKIVLDDIPSTPTYRMQQLSMLSEITKSLPPQLQGQIIDFVIEATDLPKRHELADRLRGAVGIKDEQTMQAENEQAQALQQEQMAALKQQQEIAKKKKPLSWMPQNVPRGFAS